MTSTTFFANRARATVGGNTISVLRGLSIIYNWDVKELYGTDSVNRVDEAKHNLKIEVNIRYSKWDPLITTDLGCKILRPTGATGEIEDTNTLYLDTVVITALGSAGGTMTHTLTNVYFNGLPYPLPENDFLVRELKGYARGGVISYA